jgi:hypothetical protein
MPTHRRDHDDSRLIVPPGARPRAGVLTGVPLRDVSNHRG